MCLCLNWWLCVHAKVLLSDKCTATGLDKSVLFLVKHQQSVKRKSIILKTKPQQTIKKKQTLKHIPDVCFYH